MTCVGNKLVSIFFTKLYYLFIVNIILSKAIFDYIFSIYHIQIGLINAAGST